jgi:hypothetical protein
MTAYANVLAGDIIVASTINDIIAASLNSNIRRARRITAKTPITAEAGYLRLDDIPVIAGHTYRITTSNLTLDSTVNNEVGAARLRAVQSATTGTAATTASTQIGEMRSYQSENTLADENVLTANWYPATNGFLSVLLSGIRITALGTFQFFASATAPVDLIVEHFSTDPGDTGISL